MADATILGSAQIALDRVAKGEGDAVEGWLAYGAALNEGRALFPKGDNERFGQWLANANLAVADGEQVNPHDQSAAMWAAANPDQFAEARAADGGSPASTGGTLGGQYASGTNFANGGISLVGEQGPELVRLLRGAQIALDRVAKGEGDAVEGWLAYGAALNEGRALFPGDVEFSRWITEWQVAIPVEAHERAAAMWAAANPDQFAEARAAGNARTVRGIHAKWGEIDAERAVAPHAGAWIETQCRLQIAS